MADKAFLAYRPGRSALHRLDPRLKIALVALATATAALAGPQGLAALLAATAALHLIARIPPSGRGLRALLPLAFIVIAGRALSAPGSSGLELSREGALQGLEYAARLLAMFLLGSLLAASTTAAGLRSALGWLLAPLPRRFRGRAVTMAGLVLSSLPLLAREVQTIRAARSARLADLNHSPLRKALSLLRPLLRRALLRSDALATAMEARCYSEERAAVPLPPPRLRDWALFALGAVLLGALPLLVGRPALLSALWSSGL